MRLDRQALAGFEGALAREWLETNGLGGFASSTVLGLNTRRYHDHWLQPLREHLGDAGLGQLSELFDAEPPYAPRGCIAQVWSVAELLHATRETASARRQDVRNSQL